MTLLLSRCSFMNTFTVTSEVNLGFLLVGDLPSSTSSISSSHFLFWLVTSRKNIMSACCYSSLMSLSFSYVD